ncbi:MAG: glycoside hydrolase family 140 protein, partial [Balneolaceae bacterium]
ATRYLENRAEKGFTVIQAVVLAELDGLRDPNPYGDIPLQDLDPAQPNEAYFEHVDFIVDKAEELGLVMGMLPAWGDKFNLKWGEGPEIFTPENAREYGTFLGERYRDKPIIWILGGDRNPEEDHHIDIINALAEGLETGDGGNHLMTYHPQGGNNSARWFHESDWLDFNMFQSGHGRLDNQNFSVTLDTYHKEPVKPVLDGEPNYEDHPIDWDPENGWFGAFETRQAAYWSMLSGAMGHTYGNHNIWQMWEPGREPISSARTPWYEAVDYPGAFQMQYFRRLFEARPFHKLVPDHDLVLSDSLENSSPALAARERDGQFMVAYIPHGQDITIDLAPMKGQRIRAYWYNPRMGKHISLKEFKADTSREFDPPGDPRRGNDWILLLDDAQQKLTMP